MAKANRELITALREASSRLERPDVVYRWSHFAHCNCGHLAQVITRLEPSEIQRRAMTRPGDWGQQASVAATWNTTRPHPRPDYGDRPALDEGAWEPENVGACSSTGTPLDVVLEELFQLGLTPDDIQHLERLSDPLVRRELGNNTQDFLHYRRENVIAYLRAWASLLERNLQQEPIELAAE